MQLEQAIKIVDEAFANINANRATHRTLETALQTIVQASEASNKLAVRVQDLEAQIKQIQDLSKPQNQ